MYKFYEWESVHNILVDCWRKSSSRAASGGWVFPESPLRAVASHAFMFAKKKSAKKKKQEAWFCFRDRHSQ